MLHSTPLYHPLRQNLTLTVTPTLTLGLRHPLFRDAIPDTAHEVLHALLEVPMKRVGVGAYLGQGHRLSQRLVRGLVVG